MELYDKDCNPVYILDIAFGNEEGLFYSKRFITKVRFTIDDIQEFENQCYDGSYRFNSDKFMELTQSEILEPYYEN